MKFLQYLLIGAILIILTACNNTPTAITSPASISPSAQPANSEPTTGTSENTDMLPTDNPSLPTPDPTGLSPTADIAGIQETSIPTQPVITRTPKATLGADDWKNLPIIPEVSDKVIEIYQTGLTLGNDPQKFSKVGDCGSTPAWFLGDFDRGPDFYNLGEHTDLEPVINEFHGSFERTSLAARSGFNASSLFSPLWSDRTYCQANESPLACEYRVNKPIIAFIMLGTNDIWKPEEFEPQMRKIIEFSIEHGVIPIISTKADNAEGDHLINMTIANLAWEYDIPLLNYWLAVQPLPDQGLQEDGAHLTWGRNFFNDPQAMSRAWPVRNLTALQALNAVWQKINSTE